MVDFDDFNDALMWLSMLYPQSTIASLEEILKEEDESKIFEYASEYAQYVNTLKW